MIWSMKCLMIRLFHACMHSCLWNQCCLETTHYLFKIWHNGIWSEFFWKVLIRTEFRGTFCFAQKLTQWAKNNGDFWKKNYLVFSLNLKWSIVIYISLQSPYLSKVWFLSYVSKCFWPIRLQDSSKCNISRKEWATK